ncbi:MAG: RsmD family RNA methyltransferase [Pseudomonadota bacterium]|nr:RsmD family RNA methyltransferase [Pseudomonadota bacterium]
MPHRREVRLIGGSLRKSRLPVLDRPGLRPTPDRVRETLYNWLGQDLSGWRVLDAFAGSGALGFEAASRGAAEVLLLEHDAVLVDSLRVSSARLGAKTVSVLRANAIAWMGASARGRYDLVLLDPPFDTALAQPALAAAAPLVAAGGYLYLESDAAWPEPPAGLEPFRDLRAGAVHAQLYRRPAAASPVTSPAANPVVG